MPATTAKADKPLSGNPTLTSLGVRASASSEAAVARLIEDGLPLAVIEQLVRLGFTRQEVHAMVIPQRTFTHRKNRGESLTADESDKAVRLARVVLFAEQVFGNREKAWRWLRRPTPLFERSAPLELLSTEAGARAVEEELVRIDEGIFV